FDSWRSLFCLIQSRAEGLYVCMEDPTQPYLIQYTFEEHPGLLQSFDSQVPRQKEISGMPVHLEFRVCHFIFAHPHTSVKLAPVVVAPYSGDWHSGLDLYKQWRATWFKAPRIPSWIQDVNSWQQLQINSPEDDLRVRFDQLPSYA